MYPQAYVGVHVVEGVVVGTVVDYYYDDVGYGGGGWRGVGR